jgi:hypothetical protein
MLSPSGLAFSVRKTASVLSPASTFAMAGPKNR